MQRPETSKNATSILCYFLPHGISVLGFASGESWPPPKGHDGWNFYIGSPARTHRSAGSRSGWPSPGERQFAPAGIRLEWLTEFRNATGYYHFGAAHSPGEAVLERRSHENASTEPRRLFVTDRADAGRGLSWSVQALSAQRPRSSMRRPLRKAGTPADPSTENARGSLTGNPRTRPAYSLLKRIDTGGQEAVSVSTGPMLSARGLQPGGDRWSGTTRSTASPPGAWSTRLTAARAKQIWRWDPAGQSGEHHQRHQRKAAALALYNGLKIIAPSYDGRLYAWWLERENPSGRPARRLSPGRILRDDGPLGSQAEE